MSRKRKLVDRSAHNSFTFPADHVPQTSKRNAVVLMEHASGSKVVRQTAVVADPEPVPPARVHRDFEDIQDLLGDSEDVETLQHSDEVIHHYIQASGRQQKRNKARLPNQFATTVSAPC